MSGEPEGREAPPPEVTRIEVIDHRRGAPNVGRVFSAWNARVELSYQDGGRTLKVFVDGDATTENVPPTLLSDEARAERYAAIRVDRLVRGSSQAGSAGSPEPSEAAIQAALAEEVEWRREKKLYGLMAPGPEHFTRILRAAFKAQFGAASPSSGEPPEVVCVNCGEYALRRINAGLRGSVPTGEKP